MAVPTLTTRDPPYSITHVNCVGAGSISSNGGFVITQHGCCWKTTANPTTLDSHSSDGAYGTGDFNSAIIGLSAGTLYHYRAYATNSDGTGYGGDVQFTTVVANTSSGTGDVSEDQGMLAVVGEDLHYVSKTGLEYTVKGTAV